MKWSLSVTRKSIHGHRALKVEGKIEKRDTTGTGKRRESSGGLIESNFFSVF